MPDSTLIDTHAHIYLDRFDEDREAVIERAREAGVEAIVLPAIDVDSIHEAIALSRAHEGIWAMAALHPSETKEATEAEMEEVAALCGEPEVVAVGESGLDYYHDRSFDERQHRFFRRHIRLAAETELPLILHNREATDDLVAILREERAELDDPGRLRGIFHCWTGQPPLVEAAEEMDFLLGVGGILTFSNGGMDEIAAEVPLTRMVVETDAPFLAPEPHRGKRNEPAWVRHVAERLAELKGLPLEEVARVTSENARRVFGLEE